MNVVEGVTVWSSEVSTITDWSPQSAGGMFVLLFLSWSVNEDTGMGLLKLPRGWHSMRQEYEAAMKEIAAAGYNVAHHDVFHVVVDDDTFYLLTRDPGRSVPYAEISAPSQSFPSQVDRYMR